MRNFILAFSISLEQINVMCVTQNTIPTHVNTMKNKEQLSKWHYLICFIAPIFARCSPWKYRFRPDIIVEGYI